MQAREGAKARENRNSDHDDKLVDSVPISAKRMGIGKSTLWELIRTGEIEAIYIGRRTLVSRKEQERYLELCTRRRASVLTVDAA